MIGDSGAGHLQGAPAVEIMYPSPERSPIFVVDDEPVILRTVSRLLRRGGYPIRGFGSAEAALGGLGEESVSLLITDQALPGMSGVELAGRALEEDPDMAVILLTGVPDGAAAAQSLRSGVADYLIKPVDFDELEEAVTRTLRRRGEAIYRRQLERWHRGQLRRQTDELRRVTVSALVALVRVMEAKDPYLKGGSQRVGELCERMARELQLDPDDIEEIRIAGLLHDIGMIATPDSILHKPSELSAEEYELVKRHVQVGTAILQPLTQLGRAREYVQHHHERLNGSGYPAGLRAEQIPPGAQIVGLADAFVALTSERPYRSACSHAEALETLRGGEAIWFDRQVIHALERALAEE